MFASIPTFKENLVFGSMPIGNNADISLNMIAHIADADIILIESYQYFETIVEKITSYLSSLGVNFNINPKIYQYSLESPDYHIQYVNQKLVEAVPDKKILVVSDEGSSLFLEPGQLLKSIAEAEKIPYKIITGPNAAITAAVSVKTNLRQFFFGASLPGMPEEYREKLFSALNILNEPIIFLLTAKSSKESLEILKNNFNNHLWFCDFFISLTMDHEKHFCGSFDEILNAIEENNYLFNDEKYDNKFGIVLLPNEFAMGYNLGQVSTGPENTESTPA